MRVWIYGYGYDGAVGVLEGDVFDDGRIDTLGHYDLYANDGFFTRGISPPADTNQVGDYIFTFYAVDIHCNNSNNPEVIINVYR